MNAWFAVDLVGRALPDLRSVAAQLGALRALRAVVVEPRVRPASPAPVTPDELTKHQGYLFGEHFEGSGRSGINAEAVWPYFDGTGVSFVQVDTGFKLQHVDLPKGLSTLHHTMKHTAPGHGLAVLGIVAAIDHADETGIIGISPGVTISGLATINTTAMDWDIPNALAKGSDVLSKGDVLLIEVDTPHTGIPAPPPKTDDGLPVEVIEPWRIMIQTAVGKGITVVEPAGNPAFDRDDLDLDKVTYTPGPLGDPFSLDPTSGDFEDSGAVMVGACGWKPVAADQHEVLPHHWYGARIDVWGWGEEVYTTACDDSDEYYPCEDDVEATVYRWFPGTSAASAIVAGAAVLIQQMWKATTSVPADPSTIRALLRDPSNGTPVRRASSGPTGRAMPDLAKIATCLTAFPDLFVRDSLTDIGAVPSPVVSMSPDVFVRQSQITDPSWLDRSVFVANDLIVPDGDNWIFLRVGNLSKSTAAVGARASVYWTESATLLVPADWNPVGTFDVPNVAADDAVLAGPFPWSPGSAALPPGTPPASS
jgi:hypothetical protein